MLKIISLVAGVLIASSASASSDLSAVMYGSDKAKSAWMNIESDRDFVERHNQIHGVLNSKISIHERESLYSVLIDTVKSYYLRADDYWNGSTTRYRQKIFMSDALMDMGRIGYIDAYDEVVDKNYMAFLIENQSDNFDTSRMRMSKGLAPIASDGKPVQLCTLIKTPNSPLFEMDLTMAVQLSQVVGEEHIQCSKDNLQDYWHFRKKLMDSNGVI